MGITGEANRAGPSLMHRHKASWRNLLRLAHLRTAFLPVHGTKRTNVAGAGHQLSVQCTGIDCSSGNLDCGLPTWACLKKIHIPEA